MASPLEELALVYLNSASFFNRVSIELSQWIQCYYCFETLKPEDIVAYTDDGTGICPCCGVDSLIPNICLPINEPLSRETLEVVNQYWFDNSFHDK